MEIDGSWDRGRAEKSASSSDFEDVEFLGITVEGEVGKDGSH